MTYLRSTWIFLFIFIFNSTVLCQTGNGSIYLKDKTTVEGSILRITSTNVEINPNGDIPFLIIPKSNISLILYEDNTVEDFSKEQTKVIVNNNNQSANPTHESIQNNYNEGISDKDLKKDNAMNAVYAAGTGAIFIGLIEVVSEGSISGQGLLFGAILGLIGYFLS